MKKNLLIIILVILSVGAWFIFNNDNESTLRLGVNNFDTYHLSPLGGSTSDEVVDYAIDMNEYSFFPQLIAAEQEVEIKVKLQNTGSVRHNFVIDELGIDSGILEPGESTTISIKAPTSPATYEIYCSISNHRDMGMMGTFSVTTSESNNQSGVAEGVYSGFTPDEFKTLSENEDILLIDVHIPEQTHIDGTDAFIPYTDIDAIEQAIKDNGSKSVALYCRSGGMSREVADALIAKGYDVFDLVGGRNAWVVAGFK